MKWFNTVALVFLAVVGYTQDSLRSKPSFSYSLFGTYGFIFAHSNDVENTANSFPIGLTTTLNWQRSDKQILDQYNCF